MRALTELGLTLLDLQQPAPAAASLEEALTLSRQLQTHPSPDRRDILDGLARVKVAAGRSAETG